MSAQQRSRMHYFFKRGSDCSEVGAAVVETAILIMLISVLSISAITMVGEGTNEQFTRAGLIFGGTGAIPDGGGTEAGPPP